MGDPQGDKPIEYTKEWYTELMAYLWQVEYVHKRTSPGDRLFAECIAEANQNTTFFHDPQWQQRFTDIIEALRISAGVLDRLTPIESLREVQLLFKYDQVLQLARLVHAKNALDCLQCGDRAGAADHFENLSDASGDLRRAAGLREEILDPANDFAALRAYIDTKQAERRRVAASQRA